MVSRLPSHLLDEILYRLDLKSLALFRCTNRDLQSYISDPTFESEYFNRVGSSLLHTSGGFLSRLPFVSGESSSPGTKCVAVPSSCLILGSCSGLVLFVIDQKLCVANPITKRFLFLDPPEGILRIFRSRPEVCLEKKFHIGFAVEQIDPTTQRFKIVFIPCIERTSKTKESIYEFVIYSGDSWRVSRTKCSSKLNKGTKPVFLDGTLHCLLKDGNIIAFNLETEQARLISARFRRDIPGGGSKKLFLGAAGNRLTLISATEDVISVYTLENENLEWALTRRIDNVLLEGNSKWKVAAFDGECIVVKIKNHVGEDGVVLHGYDMRANMWRVLGFRALRLNHLYHFTPSWSSVVGVEANPSELKKNELAKLKSVYNQERRRWYKKLVIRHKLVKALSSFF